MSQKENTLFNELQFWSFLGPVILSFTSAIALLTLSTFSLYLFGLVVLGGFACWKWKGKALLPAVTLFSLGFLIGFREELATGKIFHLGILITFILAFIAFTYAYDEADDVKELIEAKQASQDSSREVVMAEHRKKMENLTCELLDTQAASGRLSAHILNLEGQVDKYKREKLLLLENLAQKEAQISDLIKSKDERIEIPADIDLEKQLFLSKKNEHRAESMLKQLRRQFDEKDDALGIARSDLFHTKEQLAVLLKEREELANCHTDPYVLGLHEHLSQLSEENVQLRDEVSRLEAIVTSLST